MDELEQRIRGARPVSGHRNLPLSDRAKRELAELMLVDAVRTTRTQRRPRRPRRSGFLKAAGVATAITSVIAAGAIATNAIMVPQAAHAATPPLLDTTATSETAQELLTQMSQAAEDHAKTPEGSYTISLQTWTLAITDDGLSQSTSIVPENHEFTRTADGAFATRVTYAQPIDQNGSPLNTDDLPAAGELSWEDSWEPGEYQFAFPGHFPVKPEDVGSYLATVSGATLPLSASESIQAMNSLLAEQQLDAKQQVALLTYLANLPDLRVAGTTIDRLGRDGVVFTSEDLGYRGYEDHIIISLATGQILATERIYHGTFRTDIPSPSVVNYYLWN